MAASTDERRINAIACESVEQHGGTVEKIIGDAVMAVFGPPTAHGDDRDGDYLDNFAAKIS